MNAIAPYAKAIAAAIVAGLAVLATSLDNDVLTMQEWVYTAIAFFTGLGAVYAIPNRDPNAEHQDESVRPPQYGAADLVTVLVIVVVVILILVLFGFLR